MKKIICLVLCAAMLASAAFAQNDTGVDVSAPSAVLIHESGAVLWEKNAHEQRQPASVTKIMTLLLIMEAIDRGDISLSDMVTASANAERMGGSQIWLEEGEQLSVNDMLKCIAVVSANDCCVAMSEHLAGTEQAFVDKMNERAKELGMNDTVFKNCHGLTEEGHVSSAYDIALMSIELLKHRSITEYTTLWSDSIRDGRSVLNTTNKLLKKYDGLTGLKTGFTAGAGYCLSASAERGNMRLVAVVLGERTPDERSADVTALLNYGFASFCCVAITADAPLLPIEVEMGKTPYAELEYADETPLLVRKDKASGITKQLETEKSIPAPVEKGRQVGVLKIYLDGETLCQIPVVTAFGVERKGLFDIFGELLKLVFCRN